MGQVKLILRAEHTDRSLIDWQSDKIRLRNIITAMRNAGYGVVIEGSFIEEDKVE